MQFKGKPKGQAVTRFYSRRPPTCAKNNKHFSTGVLVIFCVEGNLTKRILKRSDCASVRGVPEANIFTKKS